MTNSAANLNYWSKAKNRCNKAVKKRRKDYAQLIELVDKNRTALLTNITALGYVAPLENEWVQWLQSKREDATRYQQKNAR